jgi:ABC-type sugar transport system substrate-binding protein
MDRKNGFRRALALLALALALTLAVAACGDSDDGGSNGGGATATDAAGGSSRASKIGLMVLDLKNAFFADQVRVVREMVEREGGELVVLDPANDPARQLQIAQTWLNAGTVDAIIGSVVDVSTFQPVFDKASEKGVPIVTLGFEPTGGLRSGQAVITQDFRDWGYQLGEAAAQCVDQRLGGRGEAVILDNVHLAGEIVPTLIAGQKEGLATVPGVEVVAQQDAPDRLRGLQVTQELLTAHPGINTVVTTSDDATLGALQALRSKGKDPKTELCLAATNGNDEARRLVESGDIYAYADTQLPLVYGTALEAAWALVANPDDPRYARQLIHTRVKVVTTDAPSQ